MGKVGILRRSAVALKDIVFDSDILCGRYVNTAVSVVLKEIIVNINIFVNACRIVVSAYVVASLEDYCADVCAVMIVSVIFDNVISYLNIFAGADLVPNADIGREEHCGKAHSVNIAVFNKDIFGLEKEASCAGISKGTAVDVNRGIIFRVGDNVTVGYFAL